MSLCSPAGVSGRKAGARALSSLVAALGSRVSGTSLTSLLIGNLRGDREIKENSSLSLGWAQSLFGWGGRLCWEGEYLGPRHQL